MGLGGIPVTMGSFVEIAKLGVRQWTIVIHHDGYHVYPPQKWHESTMSGGYVGSLECISEERRISNHPRDNISE